MNEKLNTKADFENVVEDATYEYSFMTSPYNTMISPNNKKEIMLCLITAEKGNRVNNFLIFEPCTEDPNLIKVTYEHRRFYVDDDGDQTTTHVTSLLLTPETMMRCLDAPFMNKFYELFDDEEIDRVKANITAMCEKMQHVEVTKHKNHGLVK